ncbi:MAG: AAA family ATPase [Lachnospiraceae bacterium]|nr:AAA family ATPase [Lachnospiraceae bacterium]
MGDLLKGLYNDLYTAGNAHLDLLKQVREQNKASDLVRKTAENSLKNANDALDEARKLFGDMPVSAGMDVKTPPVQASTGDPVPPAPEPEKPAEPETDPIEDLNALIGLSTIKHDVKELTDFVKVQKLRKDAGLKSVPTSLHLVFTGNPGTGKTTVARIIGRIYKKIGVLSKGQLIEVDRSGLVAGYVGQTAIKTQQKIQEAMGGVLFIDEAYALSGGDQDAFGQEAINTLLKAMEDHRDDLIIIVAGYTKPMEHFIASNPGLKSRFNKYIEFPDYTLDELQDIFMMNVKKYDYTVSDEVLTQIRGMIAAKKLLTMENFANAREVRNLFEEVITNQARRIAAMENPTAEDIMAITMDDLVDADKAEEAKEAVESALAETEAEIGMEPASSAGSEPLPAESETAEPEYTSDPE